MNRRQNNRLAKKRPPQGPRNCTAEFLLHPLGTVRPLPAHFFQQALCSGVAALAGDQLLQLGYALAVGVAPAQPVACLGFEQLLFYGRRYYGALLPPQRLQSPA